MKSTAFFIVLVIIIMMFFAHIIVSWIDYNKSIALPEKNAAPFREAIKKYHKLNKKYPKSLDDLVNGSFLPENSVIYSSFLKEKSISNRALNYRETNLMFDFASDPENPKILFPKNDLEKYWIPERKKTDRSISLKN